MSNPKPFVISALLLCLALAVFSPCLNNGFINLDDPDYVTDNPALRQPFPQNLRTIFSSLDLSAYTPLTTLSYALEYHLFKLDPRTYHFDNIVLHLFNIALVLWLVYLLTGRFAIALIIAALFGVHPLRVESVAWVSERKDLLFALFYLGGLISYVQSIKKGRRKPSLAAPLSFFILSCLAKPQAMSFPLALLAVDHFYERGRWGQLVLEKLPLFAVTALFAMIHLTAAQARAWDPQMGGIPAFSSFEKFLFTNFAVLVYLAQSLWPANLSIAYPYPSEIVSPFRWIVHASPFINLALIAVLLRLSRTDRAVRFGALFFLITLSLPLGLISSERIFVHDRYTYLPHVGFFTALVCLLADKRSAPILKKSAGILLAICVISLSTISFYRCKVWHDSRTLWADAFSRYPDMAVIYLNRGPASRSP